MTPRQARSSKPPPDLVISVSGRQLPFIVNSLCVVSYKRWDGLLFRSSHFMQLDLVSQSPSYPVSQSSSTLHIPSLPFHPDIRSSSPSVPYSCPSTIFDSCRPLLGSGARHCSVSSTHSLKGPLLRIISTLWRLPGFCRFLARRFREVSCWD
jgi:hypothetical protein